MIRIYSILIVLIATSLASGQTLGLDLSGSGSPQNDPRSFTVGWAFDVTQPINLSGLGLWDEGSDGLATSHLIQLWDFTGTSLIASATATNASTPVASGIPEGRWLFESITPVFLPVGRYVIGADGGFDVDAVRLAQGFLTASPITFLEDRQITPQGFPTTVTGTNGLFGPTFEFTAVPEPTTWALIGFGIVGATGVLYRKKKKNALALAAKLCK
jgi:PEP-CTERM motif